MDEKEWNSHDTCSKCVCRGDLEWCEETICTTRHSWYVGELRKRIAELETEIKRLKRWNPLDKSTWPDGVVDVREENGQIIIYQNVNFGDD